MDAAAEVAANVQAQRIREVQRSNLGMLNDPSAGVFRSARQTGKHFARVHGAAWHAADDFQLAGIAPGDGRTLRRSGAGDLPDARKRQARVYAESAENFLVAGEHIAESGELVGRGSPERHAAGAAAGAVTERSRLQHKDGPPGSKPAQPGRRGKAREATANNGEIHLIRQSARSGTEIDGPGRHAPGMNFAAHGNSLMQRECGRWHKPPRISQGLFAGHRLLNSLMA